mmetsp:Transcript_47971/g.138872  ORF Transcript_47971/g.138872 Transcript_47971/m.138872 type:complete len:132 (+) Transcript_47971:443-838(+)
MHQFSVYAQDSRLCRPPCCLCCQGCTIIIGRWGPAGLSVAWALERRDAIGWHEAADAFGHSDDSTATIEPCKVALGSPAAGAAEPRGAAELRRPGKPIDGVPPQPQLAVSLSRCRAGLPGWRAPWPGTWLY